MSGRSSPSTRSSIIQSTVQTVHFVDVVSWSCYVVTPASRSLARSILRHPSMHPDSCAGVESDARTSRRDLNGLFAGNSFGAPSESRNLAYGMLLCDLACAGHELAIRHETGSEGESTGSCTRVGVGTSRRINGCVFGAWMMAWRRPSGRKKAWMDTALCPPSRSSFDFE